MIFSQKNHLCRNVWSKSQGQGRASSFSSILATAAAADTNTSTCNNNDIKTFGFQPHSAIYSSGFLLVHSEHNRRNKRNCLGQWRHWVREEERKRWTRNEHQLLQKKEKMPPILFPFLLNFSFCALAIFWKSVSWFWQQSKSPRACLDLQGFGECCWWPYKLN